MALKTYAGNAVKIKGTRMVSGTLVRTMNGSSFQLHSWAEIQQMFKNAYGFTPTDALKLGVSAINGDGVAMSTPHPEGITYLNGIFYLTLASHRSGATRVNYAYFYYE